MSSNRNAGLRLVLADVGEAIEDEEVRLVEPGDGCLELEVVAGGLEPLDEVGGAREQHARTALDQRQAERGPKTPSAGAGGPNMSRLAPSRASCRQRRVR